MQGALSVLLSVKNALRIGGGFAGRINESLLSVDGLGKIAGQH